MGKSFDEQVKAMKDKRAKIDARLAALKKGRYERAGIDLYKLGKEKGEKATVKELYDIFKKYWADEAPKA